MSSLPNHIANESGVHAHAELPKSAWIKIGQAIGLSIVGQVRQFLTRPAARLITLLFVLLVQATLLSAQVDTTRAQVTYIAGRNLYLDIGSEAGIQQGDSLLVHRDTLRIGTFLVIASTPERSVVAAIGSALPVEIGTPVTLVKVISTTSIDQTQPELETEKKLADPADEPPPVVEKPPPERTTRTPTRRRSERDGPDVSGRVLLSVNSLQSETRWGTSGGDSRRFITPNLNLNTRVTNLAGGLGARIRLRSARRFSSGNIVDPAMTVRAYELFVEKRQDSYQIQAGRFTNPHAPYTGYWDGAMVHLGGNENGIGTSVGFLPKRGNEGLSFDMPRFSAFGHAAFGERGGPRYSADLFIAETRPSNHLLPHRFVGLSHRISWSKAITLRNTLQLDRDPETGRWLASRADLRASTYPVDALLLHGRLTLRRPYSIWRSEQVFSNRRDQAAAGFSFQIDGATIGGDFVMNYITRSEEERKPNGRSTSAYLQVPRTGFWKLGFSAVTSYWYSDVGSTFFSNLGLTRQFGDNRLRLNYQYYRTGWQTDPIRTHAGSLHAMIPLTKRIYTHWQLRLQRSDALRSVALYSSIWYSF